MINITDDMVKVETGADVQKALKKLELRPKVSAKLKFNLTLNAKDWQMLLDLYKIRSYSGFEKPMVEYVTNFLDKLKIPYINYNGNIIGIHKPDAPLFSAHLDMVNTERYKLKENESSVEHSAFTVDKDSNIRLYRKNEEGKVISQTSLGADDKNGIFIILKLIQMYGTTINFAFFHGEEVGCVGSSQVVEDPDLAQLIEVLPYAVVLDRRNKTDIIGYGNKYCMALDDLLQRFSAEHGFKYTCAHGLCSDANNLSLLTESVNLSVGYYSAHSSEEYTNLSELDYALDFVEQMLLHFTFKSVSPTRLRDFKSAKKPYKTQAEVEEEAKREAERAKREEEYKIKNYNGAWSGHQSKKTGGTKDATKEKNSYPTQPLEITVYDLETDKKRGENVNAVDVMTCPYCGQEVYVSQDDSADFHDSIKVYDHYRKEGMIEYACAECGELFTPIDTVTMRDQMEDESYGY